MLILIFLLALENDLGEVETSWPFIVNFYYKIIIIIIIVIKNKSKEKPLIYIR